MRHVRARQVYEELADRALVMKREADYWVPSEVVRLTESFIRKLNLPDVPVAPFMHLLVQLNKIWRSHALERVETTRKSKDREIRTLKRVVNSAKPVDIVVKDHRIKQLKKEKAKTELKAEKLKLQVKADLQEIQIKEICLKIELLLKAKHLVFKVLEILTELDF